MTQSDKKRIKELFNELDELIKKNESTALIMIKPEHADLVDGIMCGLPDEIYGMVRTVVEKDDDILNIVFQACGDAWEHKFIKS
ncbi:MAG: hypothetical protein PHW73_00530 [Atribacterota bacterium]|nr:hypothetical protein [Atribacterota bacterium]